MTNETCARCDAMLASRNRHPARLCGECQQELHSYLARPHQSKEFQAWIKAGRPKREKRVAVPVGVEIQIQPGEGAKGSAIVGSLANPASPPLPPPQDVTRWPHDLLRAAAAELARRQRRIAEEIEEALRDGPGA